MKKNLGIITSFIVLSGLMGLFTMVLVQGRFNLRQVGVTSAANCQQELISSITGISGTAQCMQIGNANYLYNNDTRFAFWQLPGVTRDMLYIQTPNSPTKNDQNLSWSVTTTQPVRSYVMFRLTPGQAIPNWLRNEYHKISSTPDNSVIRINVSGSGSYHPEGNIGVYDIFESDAQQGSSFTYGPATEGANKATAMYLVGFVPVQVATNEPSVSPQTPPPQTPPPSTGGYTVKGNTIYDANNQPHMFRGIDRPSLEWSATGSNLSLADYQKIRAWGANVVRLAVNQQFWRNDTSGYRARMDQNIQWIKQTGMDVIIDLHWSDKGTNSGAGQQLMPDSNSVTFWSEVATKYKTDAHVLFELYNEPHGVNCSVWQNGGATGAGWNAAGMQQLYDSVRATGATNLVLVGGLNWAFDLTCAKTNPISGYNIVYATHPYGFSGKNTVADWESKVGFLTVTHPVVITEFGDTSGNCSALATFDRNLITWAESKKIGWTAWAWYPGGCAFPSLITDWNGTPNEAGTVVKQFLLSNGQTGGTTSPTQTPAPSNQSTPLPPISGGTTISVDINSNAGSVNPLVWGINGPTKELAWDNTMIQRIRDANIKAVRIPALQYMVRHGNGNCDLNALDVPVKAVFSAGAEPVFTLTGYACNLTKGDWNGYANFMKTVVTRYNSNLVAGKKIRYWEMWNEPTIEPDGVLTQSEYASFVNTVGPAMKSVDSSISLLGPVAPFSDLSGWVVWTRSNLPSIDILTWHDYGPQPDSNDTARLAWPIQHYYNNPKSVAGRTAITEYNMSWVDGGSGYNSKYSSNFDAVYTASSVINAARAKMELFTFFALREPGGNLLGLLNADNSPRKPYYALSMFGNHTGTTLINGTGGTSTIEYFATKGNGKIYIIVVNKGLSGNQAVTINLNNSSAGSFSSYLLDSTHDPVSAVTASYANGQINYSMPPLSVVAFEV